MKRTRFTEKQIIGILWGTDMTSVANGQGQVNVFIAVDQGSAECVGIHGEYLKVWGSCRW